MPPVRDTSLNTKNPHFSTGRMGRARVPEVETGSDCLDDEVCVGRYLATNCDLFGTQFPLFFSHGRMCAIAALEALHTHRHARILTNSLSIAWHYQECLKRGILKFDHNLELLGGYITPYTASTELRSGRIKLHSDTLIMAPGELGEFGLTQNRSFATLQNLWSAHRQVILLATHNKFRSRGLMVLKHIGFMRRETTNMRREIHLILPMAPKVEVGAQQRLIVEKSTSAFLENGIKVHWAPPLTISKNDAMHHFFSEYYTMLSSESDDV